MQISPVQLRRSTPGARLAAPLAVVVVMSMLAGPRLVASSSAVPVSHPDTPILRLGSQGQAVRNLQSTLARLTYLPVAGVDGRFGVQTWHAVLAFQGWNGLIRDGIVGPLTSRALRRARRPAPWSPSRGIEVHLPQQVLLLISGGRVQRAIHVSTGANGATPAGHFSIYRREPMSWSTQFHVWMPLAQYFYSGYAMHEYSSVPPYPASHGCVRIPAGDAIRVWRFGSIGMRVWTRP